MPYAGLATGMALCALISSPAWAQTQAECPTAVPPRRLVRRVRPPRLYLAILDCGMSQPGRCCRKAGGPSALYRTNWDRKEAFSDISNFRATVRIRRLGPLSRSSASIDAQRRIDADRRPVRSGGAPMDDPFINQEWQTGFGDVNIGGKINMTSPWRQQRATFALRAVIKIPTSDTDNGIGTGKLDFFFDGDRQRRSIPQG